VLRLGLKEVGRGMRSGGRWSEDGVGGYIGDEEATYTTVYT
jgi:hypothetical protein